MLGLTCSSDFSPFKTSTEETLTLTRSARPRLRRSITVNNVARDRLVRDLNAGVHQDINNRLRPRQRSSMMSSCTPARRRCHEGSP